MTLLRRVGTSVGNTLSAGLTSLNARHPWSHNDHFHSWILANMPQPCDLALDVGCGQGELVAALAPHARRVIGTDVDAEMREQAVQRCGGLPNVSIVGDDWTTIEGGFDLLTMVAVLHHLDVAEALRSVRLRLKPGGRFLAVGLAPPRTAQDHAWDVASIITNPVIGFVKHPRPSRTDRLTSPPFPIRDPNLSFEDLQQLLDQFMPGAILRHRLGFRHTIAWTHPG